MLIMVYYQIYSPANIICFLIGSVFIILPGLAIGFFLASFSFFKEDIKRIVGLILRPLMFASATIFPMPKVGVLSYVDSYNPVAVMINNIRSLAINADFYDFGVFCIWVILLFSFLLFSWKLFKFSIVFAIDRL